MMRVEGRILKFGLFTSRAGACLKKIFDRVDAVAVLSEWDNGGWHFVAPKAFQSPLNKLAIEIGERRRGDILWTNASSMLTSFSYVSYSFELLPEDLALWCRPAKDEKSFCFSFEGEPMEVGMFYQDLDGEVSVELCNDLLEAKRCMGSKIFLSLVEEFIGRVMMLYLDRFKEENDDCLAVARALLSGSTEKLRRELAGEKLEPFERAMAESLVKQITACTKIKKAQPLDEKLKMVLNGEAENVVNEVRRNTC